jgi:hypothetical protein
LSKELHPVLPCVCKANALEKLLRGGLVRGEKPHHFRQFVPALIRSADSLERIGALDRGLELPQATGQISAVEKGIECRVLVQWHWLNRTICVQRPILDLWIGAESSDHRMAGGVRGLAWSGLQRGHLVGIESDRRRDRSPGSLAPMVRRGAVTRDGRGEGAIPHTEPDGLADLSGCLPAFSPATVHRGEGGRRLRAQARRCTLRRGLHCLPSPPYRRVKTRQRMPGLAWPADVGDFRELQLAKACATPSRWICSGEFLRRSPNLRCQGYRGADP